MSYREARSGHHELKRVSQIYSHISIVDRLNKFNSIDLKEKKANTVTIMQFIKERRAAQVSYKLSLNNLLAHISVLLRQLKTVLLRSHVVLCCASLKHKIMLTLLKVTTSHMG